MKKILTFSIATTALTLSAFAQTSIFDSFDYGTGVSGRTGISTGDSINGVNVLDSTGTWTSTGTDANVVAFDGSAGIGNGQLDMTTTGNSTAYTAFDFSAGIVNATINFTMTTQGSSGAAGLYLGFQATVPDNGLLTNQKSDVIWLKVSANNIGFRSRTDGETINSVASINWISGNSGSMNLAYDLSGNSVTATITQGGTTIFTDTLNITTTSGYTPSFGSIALNTITMDTVTIQDINVAIPEPQTYAVSLGALALALAATRRQQRNK